MQNLRQAAARLGGAPRERLSAAAFAALGLFSLHRGGYGVHSRLPIGKQVDILDLRQEAAGNVTLVEPHRDHEDLVERHAAGAFQSKPQFGMKSAALRSRIPPATAADEVGGLDSGADGARPILSRREF